MAETLRLSMVQYGVLLVLLEQSDVPESEIRGTLTEVGLLGDFDEEIRRLVTQGLIAQSGGLGNPCLTLAADGVDAVAAQDRALAQCRSSQWPDEPTQEQVVQAIGSLTERQEALLSHVESDGVYRQELIARIGSSANMSKAVSRLVDRGLLTQVTRKVKNDAGRTVSLSYYAPTSLGRRVRAQLRKNEEG
ncbi:MAG: hypothetical protein ACR2RB_17715 [Gammaproteobacteria bacterium]